MQILICNDVWKGIFTPHGYGGWTRNVSYWALLEGPGPVYIDPKLTKNGGTQFVHRGTISIDRKNARVSVELNRVSFAVGSTLVLEPSPANGIYPIKRINHLPILVP